MKMNKIMILYTILYLGYRLIFGHGSPKNPLNFFLGLFILIYWIVKNRNYLKRFLNNFKDDIRQGKLIYTSKQIFNIKRLFFGRIRHETINFESLSDRDANRIYSAIKSKNLRGYFPTLITIKTKEEIRDFIDRSLEEYKNFNSINFKIVYNTIFYIPFGPTLIENFFFKRVQRFYKKFAYRFDKKVISLPVINFIDKGYKIVSLEWNFDNNYKKYEKDSLDKLVKFLFNKMEISKIIVKCFNQDIESQRIFEEYKFERDSQENDLIIYEIENKKRN